MRSSPPLLKVSSEIGRGYAFLVSTVEMIRRLEAS
jgi:hypothetical protein